MNGRRIVVLGDEFLEHSRRWINAAYEEIMDAVNDGPHMASSFTLTHLEDGRANRSPIEVAGGEVAEDHDITMVTERIPDEGDRDAAVEKLLAAGASTLIIFRRGGRFPKGVGTALEIASARNIATAEVTLAIGDNE